MKLVINQKLYDKFEFDSNAKKVINLYGYKTRDSFFNSVIKFLNEKYSFLNIDGIEIMNSDDCSIYNMYNGYVSGVTGEYSEVLVSFSDPYTKEGNTIISQQVMPMLQSRISQDLNFLYNKKIKRIFLLTSLKSSAFDVTKNSIKEDNYGSTLQLLVKCLRTLLFDVYPFFTVFNLDTNSKYNSVKELVDNMDYIRSQNSGNLQHKYIELNDNTVIGSFAQKPKGQDEKYFALRYVTAIYLNKHNIYDVSQAYVKSEKSQMMEMVYRYANYVQTNDLIAENSSFLSDEEFKLLVEKEDTFLQKLKLLAEEYGEDGNRIISQTVRLSEVQTELRNRLIKKHGGKCLLCGITNKELLIASHIKPAAECDIYGKADLENAFLLCALHDKLFDRCLISFSFIDGKIMISDKLTDEEKEIAGLDDSFQLPTEMMSEARVDYLIWHNEEFEKKNGD